MNESLITGLRSGHGVPAREASFADSRTVLRACQEVELLGQGCPPIRPELKAPRPVVHLNAEPLAVEWDPLTGTGRAHALLHGHAPLTLAGV